MYQSTPDSPELANKSRTFRSSTLAHAQTGRRSLSLPVLYLFHATLRFHCERQQTTAVSNNAATWVDEYRTGSRSDRLARLSPVNLRCTSGLLTHPNWLTNQELFDRPHLRMPKLDAGRYRSRFCICFTPRFGFTVKGSKLLQLATMRQRGSTNTEPGAAATGLQDSLQSTFDVLVDS